MKNLHKNRRKPLPLFLRVQRYVLIALLQLKNKL